MSKYWKGFIVGFLAALCLVVGAVAFAQGVEEVMRGKVLLLAGECPVDVNELMTKDVSKRVKTYVCTVGKDPSEPDDVLWFVFSDERGAYQIIRMNGADDTQEIKWKRGRVGA